MAKGYHTSGDILTRTRDGQDLNQIWRDYNEALAAFNATRQPLIDFLSFTVTSIIEDIVQPGQERFEKASEFGIPKGVRPQPTITQRAFPFDWWDTRAGYTFQFLAGGPGNSAGASSAQLDAVLNQVMEADNALQFDMVMKALFNSANRTTTIDNASVPYTVTALYNADSSYIPPYRGTTFDGATHTHYIGSGANAGQTKFDPADFTALANLVEEHGYNATNGYSIIFLMNKADAQASIQTFRRGVAFVSGGASTVESLYDFIPSQATNTQLLLPPGYTLAPQNGLPGNTFAGMDVLGSWGPYLVVTDNQIPTGYMVAIATQGRSTNTNVIGIREHANAGLRGVVLRPGNTNNYPLIDSFFIRGLGSGVSQRGGAAIMKLDNTGGAYTVPSAFAW